MGDFIKELEKECQEIEYKIKETDEMYKTVSAFANTDGGCLVLGVEDKTQNIVGIDLSNGKQEAIINKIVTTMGIQPDVRLHSINGYDILQINVCKSSNPIQYKGKSYRRVGNTTREMNLDELRKLLLSSVSWDAVESKCSYEEIEESTIKRFLTMAINKGRLLESAANEDAKSTLEHLCLLTNGKLTNGAVLLFCKNPQKYFVNANVRVGRFKGRNEVDIIDDKLISGNLFEQIENAEIAIKLLISKRYDIKGTLERKEIWDYPLAALREALLNTVIHRDYHDFSSETSIKIFDDRIWFHNPGGLYGGLTLEQLKVRHPSKSRNPLVMNVMYLSGLVEKYGSGTQRMICTCTNQGIPSPEFKEECEGFSVFMYKEHQNLNERQHKALQYLVENKSITNSIYQDLNKASRAISKRDLAKLCNMEILQAEGEGKNTRYVFKKCP